MPKRLVFSLILAFPLYAATPTEEAFQALFSRKLLQNLFDMPISENRSIAENVMGTVVRGTALTEGRLFLQVIPNPNVALFNIRVETSTRSHSIGRNVPRKDITIDIHSTALTHLYADKPIVLAADSVSTRYSRVEAATYLTYDGVGVRATGPFANIKERIAKQKALQKIMQGKADAEYQASVRARTEMTNLLEERMNPFLPPLNRDYQSIFYRPLFASGRVPGDLHFSTIPGYISMGVRPHAGFPPGSLEARPDFSLDCAGGLRLQEAFLADLLKPTLAGKTMDEEDLEEFFIVNGLPAGLGHYRPGAPQLQLRFGATPLEVRFAGQSIELALTPESVSFAGRNYRTPVLRATYQLSVADGNLRIERDPRVPVGGGLEAEVEKRLARIFPVGITLGKMAVPQKLNLKGELRVKRAEASRTWFLAEWELAR